ncbi:MAG: hypothetical protein HC910_05010 [Spirulinaceae cyanobacterium SM2_1_0]|nr:hypothetical protein [Spirulinaceae cyanobacterium SM2_1_0]
MQTSWRRWQRRLVRTLSVSILGLGLTLVEAGSLAAAELDTAALTPTKQAVANTQLTDGTYFFGQVPEAGVIGYEYLVFEIRNGRVMGAIYAPRSEYSCFTGTAQNGVLALSITDPYDDQVYPYAIALETPSTLAAGQAQSAVSLTGHHRIQTLRELEQQLLTACRP